jgi:hypothetical protein
MADENTPRPYSRAAFERSVALRSETAQRFLEREFERVAAALYHLEVIQRILAPEEEVELREEEARSLIQSIQSATQNEIERLLKLSADHGVQGEPVYTYPSEIKVMITSPLTHDYLGVIQTLDQLIFTLDGLWLMGVLNNKQRANAVFLWQRTILKLGRRLIGRQRRINTNPARLSGEANDSEMASSTNSCISLMIEDQSMDPMQGGEKHGPSPSIFPEPVGGRDAPDASGAGLAA